jgi:hypothetical protein
MQNHTNRWAFQRTLFSSVNEDNTVFFGDANDEPKEWTLSFFYSDNLSFLPVGYGGANFKTIGQTKGSKGTPFDYLKAGTINAIIPYFGLMKTFVASRIDVSLVLQNSTEPVTVEVVGAPFCEVNNDTTVLPVDGLAFDMVPPFSVCVSADPAYQTVEILDPFLNVVQTIVLEGHTDFAPIDPRGFLIRNTANVFTNFIFVRKGLY